MQNGQNLIKSTSKGTLHLGFPDNVATVMQSTEVEGAVTTDKTETTEQKETLLIDVRRTMKLPTLFFFPFQENSIMHLFNTLLLKIKIVVVLLIV